tara:strand:- start:280 stop:795 length:516 start_codon:yes stop_codon:yes gene_type:complete
MRSEEPEGYWTPKEWLDRAIDTIHRMSDSLTDGLVDFEFMKAALKIAGFSLMTDVPHDDRHPMYHVEGTSGQTHFLDETMADRYMAQSFSLELTTKHLIPSYTPRVCLNRESLDSLLGSFDDSTDRSAADYNQWLIDSKTVPRFEAVENFSWKIEDYLHSRLHGRRYPAKH